MVRILGPLQRRAFPSGTLVAATLTAIDVDFGLSELGAVLIVGIDGSYEPSAITSGDDRTIALIGRPDVAVQTVTESGEPWDDPDFIGGDRYRTSFSTNGGMVEPLSFAQRIMGEGVLISRRASAMFFDDNAVELTLGIWYHRALLSEQDLVNLVIAGRR